MSYSFSFNGNFFPLFSYNSVLLLFVYHCDGRIEHCHYQCCCCCTLSTRNNFFPYCLVIAEKKSPKFIFLSFPSTFACLFFCPFVSFVPLNFAETKILCVGGNKKEISNKICTNVQRRSVCFSFS